MTVWILLIYHKEMTLFHQVCNQQATIFIFVFTFSFLSIRFALFKAMNFNIEKNNSVNNLSLNFVITINIVNLFVIKRKLNNR